MRLDNEGLPKFREQILTETAAHWRVDIECGYTVDSMAASHDSMTSKGSFQGKNLYFASRQDPTRDELNFI